MSTFTGDHGPKGPFTPWDGPQGPSSCCDKPSVKSSDIIELINAYQAVLNRLNEHIADKPGTTAVHGIRYWVETLLEEYTKLSDLTTSLGNYYTKADIDNSTTGYAKKTSIDAISNVLITKADKTELLPKADKTELDAYVKKAEFDTINTIVTIKADIDTLEDKLKGLDGVSSTFDWAGLITTSKIIVDSIETAVLNTRFRDIVTHVGGSDTKGVFYTLCMLTETAGTVYCTFKDDVSMSASVQYVVDKDTDKASLSVLSISEGLSGLTFHVVYGTSADGVRAYYLAVRANEWINLFASTDGVGYHDSLTFKLTGTNIALNGDDNYITPNGSCIVIGTCLAGNGLTASEFSITMNELNTPDDLTIFKVVHSGNFVYLFMAEEGFDAMMYGARPYLLKEDGSKSPFLTRSDLSVISDVGTIRAWPTYENIDGVMIAKDYPSTDLPCDGRTISAADYPALYNLLPDHKLPVIDYHIIKAVTIDVLENIDVPGGTLADAVATLHDSEVYASVADLPVEAPIGALAIVYTDGIYFVYEKTINGWGAKQND